MPSIYEIKHEPEVAEVLEQMRIKLSGTFGVTVTGNRCTIVWEMNKQVAQVHMIIESITTPSEHHQDIEQAKGLTNMTCECFK